MALIGNLRVGLSANSAKLQKDLAKARKRTKKFSRGVSADFKRAGQALAAAFTAQAFKAYAQRLDDLAKNARSVGLSGKDFQLLTGALEQMGVSSTVAHKSLINIQKAVGEAGIGTKTYTDALELIGLSYQEIATLDPAAQFLTITDALKNTADVNTRALAGNRLLGRAYKDLGTVINSGSAGVIKLTKELDALGVVISDEALEATEEMNDAWDTLSRQLLAVASEVLTPLVKGVTFLTKAIILGLKEYRGFAITLLKVVGTAAGIALLAKAFVILKFASIALAGALQKVALAVVALAKRLALFVLTNPIGIIATAIIGLIAVGLRFKKEFSEAVGGAVSFVYEQLLNLKTIFQTLLNKPIDTLVYLVKTGFLQIQQSVIDGLRLITRAAIKYLPDSLVPNWVKSANNSLNDLSKNIQDKQDELARGIALNGKTLAESFAENAKIAGEAGKVVEEATLGILMKTQGYIDQTGNYILNKWDEISAKIAGVNEQAAAAATSPIGVSGDSAGGINAGGGGAGPKEMGTTFAESFVEGLQTQNNAASKWVAGVQSDFAKGIKGNGAVVAAGLAQTLGQLAGSSKKAFELNKKFQIASAIVDTYKAFTAALANPPGPPFSYAIAAGALATGFAQVSAISSQTFNPPRRFGGPVSGGLPGLVGENGPEVFVPDSDGTIIPNAADRGGSFSGPIYVDARTKPVSVALSELNEENVRTNGTGFSQRRQYGV